MNNRPRSREKRVTGSASVNKRPGGLGNGGSQRNSGGQRAGGGSMLYIIIALAVALFGGGSTLLGGDSSGNLTQTQPTQTMNTSDLLTSILGGYGSSGGQGPTTNTWGEDDNTGTLNTSTVKGARDKYTTIKGNNKDVVTIMVYMCGTDLESRSGMATKDLQEMLSATVNNPNLNVLVYTGGCRAWKNNVVSSKTNQIYQIQNGKIALKADNMGSKSMTDPATLTEFIKWCTKNYPANRNELILWDHGGGSLTAYGYDEKFNNGSMNLTLFNQALKNAGTKFDFIGFDACLMATYETALVVENYCDYLIASEETEPGIGWYYTNWLTQINKNTSTPTIDIAKTIIDDFVSECNKQCRGQGTTLSIIDVAELVKAVPDKFEAFAKETGQLIQSNDYKKVSNARYQTREFAKSNRLDQVDLVHLANNMNTKSGTALAKAVLSAVKYNRTSSSMTNAYGLSIYFPYQQMGKVDTAVKTYNALGISGEYSKTISAFAKIQTGGQQVSGGTTNPYASLVGGSSSSTVDLSSLLGSFLSGQLTNMTGLGKANTSYLDNDLVSDRAIEDYLTNNTLDASKLKWDANGKIELSEEEWSLVQSLALNMFYDDGSGYIDLGLDNVFAFDNEGRLMGEHDSTWLAINNQVIPYYFDSIVDDGHNYTITGHVNCLLNKERATLIIVFDNENPYGSIAGAKFEYDTDLNETVAKNLTQLEDGDRIDLICDYYSYSGEFLDNYYLGDPIYVSPTMDISNVVIHNAKLKALYRFTDIYNQEYWTDPIR